MTSWVEATPSLPALIVGHVAHERFAAKHHAFRYAHTMWLLDLAHLPKSNWAKFLASDHLGQGADLRENLATFAATHSENVTVAAEDRVLLLTNPRSFGYAFNPLSVFWVLDVAGRVKCIVAEIHNTYGERHAHLILPPDGSDTGSDTVTGIAADTKATPPTTPPATAHAKVSARGHVAARVAKEFYVSPFFDVSGEYRMTFGLTPGSVRLGITLRKAGRVAFTASFSGDPRPITRTNLMRHAVRTFIAAHRTMALIRLHGIWLWARGLPITPRTPHKTPKAV